MPGVMADQGPYRTADVMALTGWGKSAWQGLMRRDRHQGNLFMRYDSRLHPGGSVRCRSPVVQMRIRTWAQRAGRQAAHSGKEVLEGWRQ
jgi:hypothetical protein